MKNSAANQKQIANAIDRLDVALDQLTDICAWFDPQPSELTENDLWNVVPATPGRSKTVASIERAATEIEILNIRLDKALDGALSKKRLAKGKCYKLTKLLLTQLLTTTRTAATA